MNVKQTSNQRMFSPSSAGGTNGPSNASQNSKSGKVDKTNLLNNHMVVHDTLNVSGHSVKAQAKRFLAQNQFQG